MKMSGHDEAAMRLYSTGGSIYAAFDALGCGIDHDEALEYIGETPTFRGRPEADRAHIAGLILGFAITAVEADRKLRRRGRWFSGR